MSEALKVNEPVSMQVFELVNHEGYKAWQEATPRPTDTEMEWALHTFFKPRPDMSPGDFIAGFDPQKGGE